MKISVVVIYLLSIFQAFSATDVFDAQHAAEKWYREYVASCLSDTQSRELLSLSENDRLEKAVLGAPIPLLRIRINSKTDVIDNSCLVPLDSYIFPVSFDNEIKLLLTVTKFKGNNSYEVQEIGNAQIARELNSIRKTWHFPYSCSITLAVHYETQIYAFSIPEAGVNNLTIITTNVPPDAHHDRYAVLTPFNKTMTSLKNVVTQHAIQFTGDNKKE